MADRSHAFLLFSKFENQPFYDRQSPKPVWHKATWQEDGVKVSRACLIDSDIRFARITVFPGVHGRSLFAGNNKRGASFDQPKLGIPQLEIFIDISDKCEDSLSKERLWQLYCQLQGSFLPLTAGGKIRFLISILYEVWSVL